MQAKERGATIAEAALTLNVLFMLLIGMLGFGVIFGEYQLMTDAAREGARSAVVAVNTPTPAQVATRVCSYLIKGLQPANCTTPHTVTKCTVAGGKFPPANAADGVYVTVCPPVAQPNNLAVVYTEVDILKHVKLPILPSIALHTTAVMRNEVN